VNLNKFNVSKFILRYGNRLTNAVTLSLFDTNIIEHKHWISLVFAYSLKHTMQDGGWNQDWR